MTLAVASEAMLPQSRRGGLKEIEAIAARVSGAAVKVVLDSGGGVKSAGGPRGMARFVRRTAVGRRLTCVSTRS